MKKNEILEMKIERLRMWSATPFLTLIALTLIAGAIAYLNQRNQLNSFICLGIALLIEAIYLFSVYLESKYQKALENLNQNEPQ